MARLDDILTVICEVVGVKKDNVADRRKIDDLHQAARAIYCRIAHESKYSYSAIGRPINRKPQQVHHNVNNGKSYAALHEGSIASEVKKRLAGK